MIRTLLFLTFIFSLSTVSVVHSTHANAQENKDSLLYGYPELEIEREMNEDKVIVFKEGLLIEKGIQHTMIGMAGEYLCRFRTQLPPKTNILIKPGFTQEIDELHYNIKLNRYVNGGRLYKRVDEEITFSFKFDEYSPFVRMECAFVGIKFPAVLDDINKTYTVFDILPKNSSINIISKEAKTHKIGYFKENRINLDDKKLTTKADLHFKRFKTKSYFYLNGKDECYLQSNKIKIAKDRILPADSELEVISTSITNNEFTYKVDNPFIDKIVCSGEKTNVLNMMSSFLKGLTINRVKVYD